MTKAPTPNSRRPTLTNPAMIVCPADPPEPTTRIPGRCPQGMNRIWAMVMVVLAVTTEARPSTRRHALATEEVGLQRFALPHRP